MPVTIPAGVDAEARLNVIWTPTQTLSVAILNGATSIELAGWLTKGTFGESAETERGTDERVASKTVYEVLGKSTFTLSDLEYVWYPQAAAAAPENKAYDTLKPRTTGFVVVRWGIDVDTALAATTQKVDVFPITVGEQVRKTPEGNAAEKLKIVQPVVVTGAVLRDQVLVA
jgi:hypothetical protein